MKTETYEKACELTNRIDELNTAIEKLDENNCENTLYLSMEEDWIIVKRALQQQKKKFELQFSKL